jgi:hypothetical protein
MRQSRSSCTGGGSSCAGTASAKLPITWSAGTSGAVRNGWETAQPVGAADAGRRDRPAGAAARLPVGSCSRDGKVNIHWATMQVSSDLIDYILVHELVHLRHPDHGLGFWSAVDRAIPGYTARRDRPSPRRCRSLAPPASFPGPLMGHPVLTHGIVISTMRFSWLTPGGRSGHGPAACQFAVRLVSVSCRPCDSPDTKSPPGSGTPGRDRSGRDAGGSRRKGARCGRNERPSANPAGMGTAAHVHGRRLALQRGH